MSEVKKIWKMFLQEQIGFLKSNTQEFCWEFGVKVGKVNFDLFRYN